jgi:hypothetical protein
MLAIMRSTFFVAAVVCLLGNPNKVAAQQTVSNYAATQLKNIQNRNSTKNFTASRYNAQAIRQGISNAGVAGVNMQRFSNTSAILSGPRQPLVGSGGGSMSKPFTRIDRGPTVSPYLALNNPFSTAEDYYNIVKPLQEQRRTNDAFSRQQYAQQRKLNQIAAQGPYRITGDPNAAPTGHGAGFMQMGAYMNTGGYFAPPTQPKSQR